VLVVLVVVADERQRDVVAGSSTGSGRSTVILVLDSRIA
jgi:hypothetical protein